jgi:GTPase SAR1 family protein
MFQRKDKGKKKATDVRKSASPPKPKQRVRRKVLFVGDYNVGKTTMVLNLRFGEKTNEFISSFYDGVNVELDSPRRLPTEEEGACRVYKTLNRRKND